MSAPLHDLTPLFRVVSYTGGAQAGYEHLSVDNLLAATPRDRAHCSDVGAEHFDLLLESDQPLTLTHLVVRGMRMADAPIKSGLLCVHDQSPADLNQCSQAVGGEACTRLSFEAALQQGDVDCEFFETSSDANMQHAAPLRRPRCGRFVHLRFLTAHFHGPRRFDIGTIALLGFRGVLPSDDPDVVSALSAPIPAALDVCVVEFHADRLNLMHSDLLMEIQRGACIHVFGTDARLADTVAAVAKSGKYNGKLSFFTADGPINDEEYLAAAIAQQIEVEREPNLAFVDADFANPSIFPGDLSVVTAESLCDWIDQCISADKA